MRRDLSNPHICDTERCTLNKWINYGCGAEVERLTSVRKVPGSMPELPPYVSKCPGQYTAPYTAPGGYRLAQCKVCGRKEGRKALFKIAPIFRGFANLTLFMNTLFSLGAKKSC